MWLLDIQAFRYSGVKSCNVVIFFFFKDRNYPQRSSFLIKCSLLESGAVIAQKLGVYAKRLFVSLYTSIAMLVMRYILNKLSVEAADNM